jgi:hypothetical protein
LIEKIAFWTPDADGENFLVTANLSFKFDLIIGNKTVMKDVVVENNGEQAFYTDGTAASTVMHLEGVGILIPPQVEFKINVKTFTTDQRNPSNQRVGCYLFGTGVLLDFNTTI